MPTISNLSVLSVLSALICACGPQPSTPAPETKPALEAAAFARFGPDLAIPLSCSRGAALERGASCLEGLPLQSQLISDSAASFNAISVAQARCSLPGGGGATGLQLSSESGPMSFPQHPTLLLWPSPRALGL